jgi:hypothetical protein
VAEQPRINRQWRLKSRPTGTLGADNFEWREESVPALADGQILVRNIYLSLDPTNRIWASETESYLPPVELGEVMRGGAIGVVEESRAPHYRNGDIVAGLLGWQSHAVLGGQGASIEQAGMAKVPKALGLPLDAHMAVLSHIGLTAYFGLFEIGGLRAGETLVVSAAAGAVGSLTGQMGKIAGCRVVGLAGSDEKCRWLAGELGFDAAINYKTENILDSLKRHCPGGIDVYFDNVGGEVLEAALALINLYARIVVCGQISQYDKIDSNEPIRGPENLLNILTKRARMEGFIVLDYFDRRMEAAPDLVTWLRDGRLKYKCDVVDGLENAPDAVSRLFEGGNIGKLMVKVSEPPTMPKAMPLMGLMLKVAKWTSGRKRSGSASMRVPR